MELAFPMKIAAKKNISVISCFFLDDIRPGLREVRMCSSHEMGKATGGVQTWIFWRNLDHKITT